MLKISQAGKTNHSITLKLEGRIVGPWVDELQSICEPLLNDGGSLTLDLAEVSFVDEAGLALLVSYQRSGAQFVYATPFLKEQLKTTSARAKPIH